MLRLALLSILVPIGLGAHAGCAGLTNGLHGQVTPPTPDAPADSSADDPGLDGTGLDAMEDTDADADTRTDSSGGGREPRAAHEDASEAQETPTPGATEWLDRAFALWHDGHFAAAVDALHEALATGSLNDPGSALAYWHMYLSEQALGHGPQGLEALSAFVSVAQDITARARGEGGEDLQPFIRSFDLPGRLARARATLNLAWAEQTHRAGHSPKQPVLVFDDVELSHFLDLAPPCAQASDARVVALQRDRDHLGRATARATIRCRSRKKERHYFFAFIGPEQSSAKPVAQAAGQ